jgi:AraC family transcriptional regulator of arabinose operon
MKGYILNLTCAEGVINNHDQQFVCRPGDMLLFPPGRSTTMAAIPMPASGITSGSTSVRAPTGRVAHWPTIFAQTGFFARMSSGRRVWRAVRQIIEAGQGGGRYSELLAINLLEQLLLRRMEAINESLHPPLDNRVRDACQYISDHLADSQFDIASVAQHVCLSPSRLSHLFRQQLGSAC